MRFPHRRAEPHRHWLVRAALGGLAGALVLEGFEATIERAVLGRDPVYSAREIVRRWLPRAARRGTRGVVVRTVLRYGYAVSLALVATRARPWLPRSSTASAALIAGTIATTELVLLPRVGAVPPLSRWRRFEPLLLVAHAAVFGLVVMACSPRLQPRTSER